MEEKKYKIFFLGDTNVGKSSILKRFIYDSFTEIYLPSIGVDYKSKNVRIEDGNITLLLYDTTGLEKFRSLIPMYIRDANIFIFVYDIFCKESFINLENWLNISKEKINLNETINFLIGNKKDLSEKREISIEEGKNLLKFMDLYLEKLVLKQKLDFMNFFIKIY